MTWTTVSGLIAFAFALSAFLDKYHNNGWLNGKAIDWVRTGLVHLFVVLDGMKIRAIAPVIMKINLPLRLLVYALTVAIIQSAGPLVLIAAFLLFGVAIPMDWLYVIAVLSLGVQALVFWVFRRISMRVNELTATAVLLVAPFLAVAASVLLGVITKDMPNVFGAVFSAGLQLLLWLSLVPMFILVLLFALIFTVRTVFAVTRRLIMGVTSAATDPRTDPFIYFSALFAVIILAVKLAPELWQAFPLSAPEEVRAVQNLPAPAPAAPPGIIGPDNKALLIFFGMLWYIIPKLTTNYSWRARTRPAS